MTVKDLLEVCGNDLKVKVRVIKDRKVRYNIIENRADIACQSLGSKVLDRKVSNVYVEAKNIFETSAFSNTKPILIINIEE
jgi:hypothetical protein